MPATGWLNNIPENAFYVGYQKQAAWGTALAPTCFHRWEDGTTADPVVGYGEDRADPSGAVAFAWKTAQGWQFTIMEKARPQTVGYTLAAVMRTGADTYTAPSLSGTLSSSVAAGATSFSTATNLGTVGTLPLNVTPGYGSTAYEVVTVDLTTKTGGGPFTYTLASSGTFLLAHNSADVITSLSTHVLTMQVAPYDPYSYEFGWGKSAFGFTMALRAMNAVCKSVRLTGQKGSPLMIQHTWYASSVAKLASLTSDAGGYEQSNLPGRPGSPFKWYDGTVFKLAGLTSGNAATMESFDLTIDNDTTPDDLQSELLTAPYFMPGDYTISGSVGFVFTSAAQYYKALLGSSAPATNASDSYLLNPESLEIKWATDAVNSLDILLPQIYYQKPSFGQPKRSAKGLHQQFPFSALFPTPDLTPQAVVQATLTNSLASQY